MVQGTEAVATVYNALQALRGRCFELMHDGRDPNVTRLLKDLTDQHARQSSEIAVLLSDLQTSGGTWTPGDAASGAEHTAPPGLPESLNRTEADILPGLQRAEESLLEAYEAAIVRQEARSPLLSLLTRHRVAIATSLQRIEALGK